MNSEGQATAPGDARTDAQGRLQALTHPLDVFYEQAGLPLPPLELVDGQAVPEPFRRLLVHTDDMTPTLERHYGGNILLQVLTRRRRGDEYIREVVLRLEGTDQPVEFGANRIWLDRFPEPAREAILAETQPLGHILHHHQIIHTCHPNAFLRLASDRLINEALNLTGAQVLWGRHNQLRNPAGEIISEVVEILRG